MVRNKITAGLGLVWALTIGSGCQQIFVGGAVSEIRGGSGHLVVIRRPSAADLLEYRNIRVERVVNEMGQALPAYATAEIRQAYVKAVTRKGLFTLTSGNPPATLVLQVSVIHYQSSGSISKLLGGFNQLICRVRLVDGATGRTLGEANCMGLSKALARSGIEELADGSAKALRRWLTSDDNEES